MRRRSVIIVLFPVLCITTCGNRNPFGPHSDTPGLYGFTTSAVVVVNPVINKGSSVSGPTGSQRSGVAVSIGPLPTVLTDQTGLAVLYDLPVGPGIPVVFPSGTLSLNVIHRYELYDLVVSHTPRGVEYLFPPVRYPIGNAYIYLTPRTFEASLINAEDKAVFLFSEGIYPGNLVITAEGVLLFGAWSEVRGPATVFTGDITVRGGNTRMRGIAVEKQLTVRANHFQAAFCSFGSAEISGNGVMLLRNEFTAGKATVPSSNAILVDNVNIP